MKLRKDQYVAAKYHGDNGDLVVGRVKSFRAGGEVTIENLLSGVTSTKKATVLASRNKVVPKREAMKLVDWFKKTGDKKEVRRRAVAITAKTNNLKANGEVQLPLPVQAKKPKNGHSKAKKESQVERLVKEFRLLGMVEQQQFIQTVAADVLKVMHLVPNPLPGTEIYRD